MKRWKLLVCIFLGIPFAAWILLCQPFMALFSWSGRSDHFDGYRYYNPEQEERSFVDFLRWRLFSQAEPWPEWVPIERGEAPPERVGSGQVRATFINHATVLLQMDGYNILTDPIFSERASPVSWTGPRRVHEPGIAFEDLPLIDIILISHSHYDSMDFPSLLRLSREHQVQMIVVGKGNMTLVRRAVTDPVQELDWWEDVTLIDGFKITFTPALHWSQRTPCDRNQALWGGFMLEGSSGRVFFAGDSGYGPHFAEIRERLGLPRLALLPIGAYDPRWFMRPNHMDPEEAVQAHLDLGAESSLAIHFDTFQLSNEGRDEPVQRLNQALRQQRIGPGEFQALLPGQSWDVP
jgi:L-ascorbate metabolism protein UlaG (beta-lactamase superfamily)